MDSIYTKKYHKSFTLKKTNSTRFDYEYKFSIEELMELANLAEYANPAQRIVLEDSATCILKKILDYANSNVFKNFKLSLQQELKHDPTESVNVMLIASNNAASKIKKAPVIASKHVALVRRIPWGN